MKIRLMVMSNLETFYPANGWIVATRPRPDYKNQLTHPRRHTRKSAALGVAHQWFVSRAAGGI